jgi:methylglutaconyl-CoA hydratase
MIKYLSENGTGILLLNRPEKRNALHPEMVKQLKEKLIEIEKDDSVKVVIIAGEGNVFCAGADLEYLNQLGSYSVTENENDSQSLAELFLQVYKLSKPTIASVNGPAIAGGCGLASVCDFIIANEGNAKFGYTEVRIGFLPAIVSIFLIKRVGESTAKQLLLSGELIDAKRAYDIGFVDYLANNSMKEALALSEKLIKNSFYSMKLTKQMIHSVSNLNVDEAVSYCIRLNTISRSADDFKKGLEKFLNKTSR